jgi:hypothetical protein
MSVAANVNTLLLGAISVANLVAALLFLRYWLSSRDRFFLYLVASFAIEAANRTASALSGGPVDESDLQFGVRVVAYLLILVAIWDKNRTPRS